jgi:hypothetical protein
MMSRLPGRAAVLLLLAAFPVRAADKPSIKAVNTPPPKELAEPVRQLLGDRCVQLLDGKGEVLSEVWFRKEVPVKATEAQVKNGLTYREVPETTLLGALRVVKRASDYRKQRIPPGVYTLRLGYQPMDGDHMGTAPYSEFGLVSPAADDKKPDLLEPKGLQEMSAKVTNAHPGVFLLYPGKGAAAEPKLVDKGEGHWVLFYDLGAKVGGKKADLPIGLTLLGASSSA